jgi:shikimate dehydrogenase
MSLRYAVFGHPVAHSRSPRIHAAFAAQAGIELAYERIDAAPDAFAAAVDAFAREGGRGANVTSPHKAAAFALCATLTPRATQAGAVNTLVRSDGVGGGARWHGDNTDGIGLVRDLRDRHGLRLDGARVLLLGAGGAGAGVAPALLEAGVAQLAVANRSPDRAAALASRLGDPRIAPLPLDDAALAGTRADIVINATSAARAGDAPWQTAAGVLARCAAAVDLGYAEAARAFLHFARDCGAGYRIDGLGMLVEQAAESFRLWHRVSPEASPVLAMLRDELGAPP